MYCTLRGMLSNNSHCFDEVFPGTEKRNVFVSTNVGDLKQALSLFFLLEE